MNSLKNIKAPTGTILTCKGWQQEAAYRMIQNNLDADNAENPEELIVYGGLGKAARNWESYHAILNSLKELENEIRDSLLQAKMHVYEDKANKSAITKACRKKIAQIMTIKRQRQLSKA